MSSAKLLRWQMQDGKQGVANAGWQMPDGKCRMANAGWQMPDGKCEGPTA
jgi:hypothetical protein